MFQGMDSAGQSMGAPLPVQLLPALDVLVLRHCGGRAGGGVVVVVVQWLWAGGGGGGVFSSIHGHRSFLGLLAASRALWRT